MNLTDIVLLLLPHFLLFILKYYTLDHFSYPMNPQYPWKICKNEVKDKDPSIWCDICNMWSHIECINISPKTYEKLQNDDLCAWYCPICFRNFAFLRLKDKRTKNIPLYRYYRKHKNHKELQKNWINKITN